MERLPVVARLQYGVVAAFLIQNFDHLLGHYSQIVALQPQQLTAEVMQNVRVVEGKITWLMHIIAACIGMLEYIHTCIYLHLSIFIHIFIY